MSARPRGGEALDSLIMIRVFLRNHIDEALAAADEDAFRFVVIEHVVRIHASWNDSDVRATLIDCTILPVERSTTSSELFPTAATNNPFPYALGDRSAPRHSAAGSFE